MACFVLDADASSGACRGPDMLLASFIAGCAADAISANADADLEPAVGFKAACRSLNACMCFCKMLHLRHITLLSKLALQ